MATADQIKGLIKACLEQDNEKIKTASLQIAAYEAKQGHMAFAREIKSLVENTSPSRAKIFQLNSPNQLFLISSQDIRFSELVVSNEVQERIERILKEFKNSKKLRKHGLANRRKILLAGNPGTGKTMTASIIASELGLSLFIIQLDKLVTKFMGETSAKLRQIFDSIENIAGVYLFDEFDAIGADRGIDNEVGEMRRVLNSFLQFIEQDMSESIIIAATNNQRILDKALFRRFDDVLYYSLPSKDEIRRLFEKKVGILVSNFVLSEALLQNAKGLSHAEIVRACDDAIKLSILNDTPIAEEQILDALNERRAAYLAEAREC